MKILLLNYEYPPVGGGGGYVSHNVAKNLVARNHEVTVVTATYRHLPAKEIRDGVTIYRLPSLRQKMERSTSFEMMTYVMLCYLFLFLIRLKGKRFDVSHIHFALPTGLIGPWVKLLWRIDYLLTIHGTDLPGNDVTRFKNSHKFSKPFLLFSMGGAASISTVTPHLEELGRTIIGRDDILVVPNGVNTALFNPKGGPRTDDLVFIGRLIPIKYPSFILKGMSTVIESFPGARLLIGGDGYLRESLERQVIQDGIQDNVNFKGWIDHELLPELYSFGKIFISVQKHDNYGSLAMLEAMACGLPVVASDTGDTKRQVINGMTGFTVEHGNHTEFVRKVTYLLTHDEEREQMGRQASEIIRNEYSWEKITDRYEDILAAISRK